LLIRSEMAAEGELRDRVVHLSRVAKVVKGGEDSPSARSSLWAMVIMAVLDMGSAKPMKSLRRFVRG